MKKRQQHYVWRSYLKAWTIEGQLQCLRGGKMFSTGLMNIGQQHDFYRLRDLSKHDIQTLHAIVDQGKDEEMKAINRNLIPMFTMPSRIRQWAEQSGVADDELRNILDEYEQNMEEDLHSSVENESQRFLEAIIKGDLSFYEIDDECNDFIYFLVMQYCRTKRMQESVMRVPNLFPSVNMENVWQVFRHIVVMNVGGHLYCRRKSFRLVRLTTDGKQEFITADQPVINTFATNQRKPLSAHELELYYPVSPSVAIILTQDERWAGISEKALESVETVSYNDKIERQSHEQLYASAEKWLLPYR